MLLDESSAGDQTLLLCTDSIAWSHAARRAVALSMNDASPPRIHCVPLPRDALQAASAASRAVIFWEHRPQQLDATVDAILSARALTKLQFLILNPEVVLHPRTTQQFALLYAECGITASLTSVAQMPRVIPLIRRYWQS